MSLIYQRHEIQQLSAVRAEISELVEAANKSGNGSKLQVYNRLLAKSRREMKAYKVPMSTKPGIYLPPTPTNKTLGGGMRQPWTPNNQSKQNVYNFNTFTPRNQKITFPTGAPQQNQYSVTPKAGPKHANLQKSTSVEEEEECMVIILNKNKSTQNTNPAPEQVKRPPPPKQNTEQVISNNEFQISLNSSKKTKFCSFLYQNYIQDLVLQRTWLPADAKVEENSISIMTYNILSRYCEDSAVYTQTSAEHLSHKHRYAKISEEIFALRPDIICLQELDKDHKAFIQPLSWCYRLIFKGFSGETPYGVGIIYNPQKVTLVAEYSIEYNSSEISAMNQPQAAILGLFQYDDQLLLVANTQLLADSKQGDVQVGQLYALLSTLQLVKFRHPQARLILCGNFNFIPNSSMYCLVTQGDLTCKSVNMEQVSNLQQGDKVFNKTNLADRRLTQSWRPVLQEEDIAEWWRQVVQIKMELSDNTFVIKKAEVEKSQITHFLSLASAYGSSNEEDTGEPLISCYKEDFGGCVDYLFYEQSNIKMVQRLDTPNQELISSFPGCPNQIFPSDHISLIAKFTLQSTL